MISQHQFKHKNHVVNSVYSPNTYGVNGYYEYTVSYFGSDVTLTIGNGLREEIEREIERLNNIATDYCLKLTDIIIKKI